MKIDKFLVLIIFLAFLSSLFWSRGAFNLIPQSDGAYYNEVANNLLNNEGFTYKENRAIVAPGYPFFIAGSYLLFGQDNHAAVRIVQIILFIISVYLIYRISSRMFNKKIAFLSSFLMSVFYVFPLSANKFNRETLMMFLLILLVFFLYRVSSETKTRDLILSGLILGFLVLTNGIAQFLFIPIFLLFLFVFKKASFKKNLIFVLLFLILYFIVVGSWQVYNQITSGEHSIAPRDGYMLYFKSGKIETIVEKNYWGHFIGHAFGYYFSESLYPGIDNQAFQKTSRADLTVKKLRESSMDTAEINKTLRAEALDKIMSQPHKYFLVTVLNLLNLNSPLIPYGNPPVNNWLLYTFAEGRHSEIPSFIKTSALLTFRVLWYAFLFFVIYGMAKIIKKDLRRIAVIGLIAVYFNFFYSAVHGIPRYSIPIYPFYFILFSVGIITFWPRCKDLALSLYYRKDKDKL